MVLDEDGRMYVVVLAAAVFCERPRPYGQFHKSYMRWGGRARGLVTGALKAKPREQRGDRSIQQRWHIARFHQRRVEL